MLDLRPYILKYNSLIDVFSLHSPTIFFDAGLESTVILDTNLKYVLKFRHSGEFNDACCEAYHNTLDIPGLEKMVGISASRRSMIMELVSGCCVDRLSASQCLSIKKTQIDMLFQTIFTSSDRRIVLDINKMNLFYDSVNGFCIIDLNTFDEGKEDPEIIKRISIIMVIGLLDNLLCKYSKDRPCFFHLKDLRDYILRSITI
ncbi:hypothetical protein NO1_1187 [Candidatus Termititenax aidoneus]|uniref:Uncharacterized protein n=1 Tax=Termititenax aidoneus TaxID=2218524 RepID=A0A388TAY7_TERA1|nr:hypothetical protein NO1_1187 [Candidatus Termititenax aidoneus]